MPANQIPSEADVRPVGPSADEIITFAELARRLPRRRGNAPTHVSTLHRWRLRGLNGVRLEAHKCGGIWVTSVEAYQRFVAALTNPPGHPVGATPAGRGGDGARRTERRLDELGL